MNLARGAFVVLTFDGRRLDAFVGSASPTGASLVVFFDGILDGCAGAMGLFADGQAYRNVSTSHAIGVEPRPPRDEPAPH